MGWTSGSPARRPWNGSAQTADPIIVMMARTSEQDLPGRILKYSIIVAMVAVGLLLFLDLLYMVRGSLEEFPTEDDRYKVRTVTAVIAAALFVTEIGLWFILRRFSPTRATGAGPGEQ